MRKYQKTQCYEMLHTLEEAHREISALTKKGDLDSASGLLEQCQESAIEIGRTVEQEEGEGTAAVRILEEYCELLFRYHEVFVADATSGKEGVKAQPEKQIKAFDKTLIKVENSIRNDLPTRYEAVFFPYKAAMWDSLESIYLAAEEDPDCDVYCVPIPYYDKDPNGNFIMKHYEGDSFPQDIRVTHYSSYHVEKRHPEMIYIHNPFDGGNYVTSVDPAYYSDRLKEYTDQLVYVPYYATAGDMSSSHALLSAYLHADHIVVQSEPMISFFDPSIPRERFLPLGSPKFDSIIRKCQNPPEPPEEWRERIERRKVFFFNTSIGGFLKDPPKFLQKMDYVFSIFQGRNDLCLIWRPHPLLESTMESMNPQARPYYEALLRRFTEDQIGILDRTPSIENTIALCDAYLGDGGTSVISLFGVAGKPVFLLNNSIHHAPGENDWKSDFVAIPNRGFNDRYCIAQGNQLYRREGDEYHYRFFCTISEYSGGWYYAGAEDLNGKHFVFPANAEHILVISDDKEIRRIELKHEVDQQGAFFGYTYLKGDEEHVFLIPNRYPAIVRFNTRTELLDYIYGAAGFNVFVNWDHTRLGSAIWFYDNKLCLINGAGTQVLKIDKDSLETETTDVEIRLPVRAALSRGYHSEDLWFIPYQGSAVIRWNQKTNTFRRYDVSLPDLVSIHRPNRYPCDEQYFSSVAFAGDKVIFAPYWGNKFVELDPESGEAKEWKSPIKVTTDDEDDYWPNWGFGAFVVNMDDYMADREPGYRFYHYPSHLTYEIDLETKAIRTVDVTYDKENAYAHSGGFRKDSQWMPYCCQESVYNTLQDFADGTVYGEKFDRELQLKEFRSVNASPEGDCGEKVYKQIKEYLK